MNMQTALGRFSVFKKKEEHVKLGGKKHGRKGKTNRRGGNRVWVSLKLTYKCVELSNDKNVTTLANLLLSDYHVAYFKEKEDYYSKTESAYYTLV